MEQHEFLFRGKKVKNGKWVEGYYVRYGYTGQEKDYIVPYYASALYAFEVIHETVGQYTGLTDKNGKKIFEGDIVKYDFGENEIGVQVAVVDYSTEFYGFVINPTGNWIYAHLKDCEVIGNIHDNPELLEVKEK